MWLRNVSLPSAGVQLVTWIRFSRHCGVAQSAVGLLYHPFWIACQPLKSHQPLTEQTSLRRGFKLSWMPMECPDTERLIQVFCIQCCSCIFMIIISWIDVCTMNSTCQSIFISMGMWITTIYFFFFNSEKNAWMWNAKLSEKARQTKKCFS